MAAKKRGEAKVSEPSMPNGDRRESVGAALGLTPAKPVGRNLRVAKAASAAEAAAERLDGLNAGELQRRKERRARKKGKA